MFVAIVDICLKAGVEDDFTKSPSANAKLCQCAGFVNRRLLKSGDGSFRILEHDSQDTFEKMQSAIHVTWPKQINLFYDQGSHLNSK